MEKQLKDRHITCTEYDEPNGHAEFGLDLGDGDIVAEIGGNIALDGCSAEEIARRLTACWNALKGWDIESIEAVHLVQRNFARKP